MRFEANIDIFLKKAIKSRLLKDKKNKRSENFLYRLGKIFRLSSHTQRYSLMSCTRLLEQILLRNKLCMCHNSLISLKFSLI